MTFILNILHRDMSLLAADRRAIAEWSVEGRSSASSRDSGGQIVDNYEKISLSLGGGVALGIAGYTQDHYYLPSIKMCAGIDEMLLKIRRHMEGFVRIHDRRSLARATSFMANQGIASFFDEYADSYFTSTYLFSPVESQSRLHRGAEEAKVLYAGSGSMQFENVIGAAGIHEFVSSVGTACTPEACIAWLEEVYKKVSEGDAGTGSEALFVASTRSNLKFHPL